MKNIIKIRSHRGFGLPSFPFKTEGRKSADVERDIQTMLERLYGTKHQSTYPTAEQRVAQRAQAYLDREHAENVKSYTRRGKQVRSHTRSG